MTRTRILAALVMAPVAIAAVLLLPTPWMMLAAAIVFLAALWEWFGLAEVDDSLARGALLVEAALVALAGATPATLVSGAKAAAVDVAEEDAKACN